MRRISLFLIFVSCGVSLPGSRNEPPPTEIGVYEQMLFEGREVSDLRLAYKNGLVHVAFLDPAERVMRYIKVTGNNIFSEIVPNTYPADGGGDLKISSSGIPFITFYNSRKGALMLAYRGVGSWVVDIIDEENRTGKFSSFVFDPDGRVHVSYVNLTFCDLMYASSLGTERNRMLVDEGYRGRATGGSQVYYRTSIALDRLGLPHISYYEGEGGALKHAVLNHDLLSWNVEYVEDSPGAGRESSIYITHDNEVWIAYWDAWLGDLKFASKKEESWEIESVDSSPYRVGKSPVLVEWDGKPVISYVDYTNGIPMIAIKKENRWKRYVLLVKRRVKESWMDIEDDLVKIALYLVPEKMIELIDVDLKSLK